MAQIRDVMTSKIKTVSPQESARQAASFMLSADTGSIPVVEDNRVIGMITDRDIAVRGVASGKGGDCSVRDLMSKDPVCAFVDDDVQTVAQRMSEAQVRRLPVLDQQQQLVGMVSLGDLSRDAQPEAAQTALQGVSALGQQHKQR